MDLRRAYFNKDFRAKGFDRNLYQTPDNLFLKLNEIFNFKYDLAANEFNAKCSKYFTEKDDSLKQAWHEIDGYLWLNPPYKPFRKWIEKAQIEAEKGAKIVILVPPLINNHYFCQRLPEQLMFFVGRINFYFGENEIKGNMFDSCLLIYDKDKDKKITWIDRNLNTVWETK